METSCREEAKRHSMLSLASRRSGAIQVADDNARHQAQGPGCWLAPPFALSRPDLGSQMYLSPGKYLLEVRVFGDGGGPVTGKFTLTSPETWERLALSWATDKERP